VRPLVNTKTIRKAATAAGLRPPPKLSLNEWADAHFVLSAESSATSGKWATLPYQLDIMRSITDPRVTHVSVMKSARVGYTLMVSAAVGYYVQHAPCSILFVQPDVEAAKSFSKDTIAPMIRDVPVLAAIMEDEAEDKTREGGGSTIQGKKYPGGRLSLIGANSGAGFRRRSCKVVIFDEVDSYPASAGSDGDPIKLGTKRTEYFWDRKIIAGSTPLIAGHSRIESLFEAGDQRRYFVPCPHCGHMDFMVFTQRDSGGHFMVFDPKAPESAHFVCSKNGCVIEHKDKRSMIERGEWRASKPFEGHASFHLWAALSYSPNATWADIAREFLEAKKGGRETLRTFINTTLGETWQESGEAPDWERLYQRREPYQIGTVPAGVKFLTAGVDVQKDRWVYEVVGWGVNKESWSIDSGVIPGDTSNVSDWARLDELLSRRYLSVTGEELTVLMLAVDSGFNTQMVYDWVRRHERNRVIAVKGSATARTLIHSPSPVDVNLNGKVIRRGAKVWPLGVDVAKSELYGWLRLSMPTEPGAPYPAGFCHFPEYDAGYFKQLTSEHLVSSVKKNGFTQHEWQLIPGRENHGLDARVYARAAAAVLGIDRMAQPAAVPATTPPVAPTARPPAVPDPNQLQAKPQKSVARSDSRFTFKGGRVNGSTWLSRKR
jgi:terminase, large subunit